MSARISLIRMINSSTTLLLRPAVPVPRLFHASATSDHEETCMSPDHLRNTFKTFPFKKHPTQKLGPPLPCHLQEEEAGLYARVDMPGVSKDGLKLRFDPTSDCLHITGEQLHPYLVLDGGAHSDFVTAEAERRKYSTSLVVKASLFNVGKIRALFEHGVLRVVIPKLKEGQSFHGADSISIIGDDE